MSKTRRCTADATVARGSKVQSLSRALALLEALSETARGLTLSELSQSTGLAPSTVHRLLNSLSTSGYAEFDEATGLWSVGLTAFIVGNAFLKKRDVSAAARPVMRQLMAATGETVNLAVLRGVRVVFIAQVESPEVMRMAVPIGSSGPIHATGVGKSLLAALPETEAVALARKAGLPGLTANTITRVAALREDLRRSRERGYAVDDEEQKPGLRCIAANVYDEHGDAVAAVSLSGPSVRVPQHRIASLGEAVMDAARGISRSLGGAAAGGARSPA